MIIYITKGFHTNRVHSKVPGFHINRVHSKVLGFFIQKGVQIQSTGFLITKRGTDTKYRVLYKKGYIYKVPGFYYKKGYRYKVPGSHKIVIMILKLYFV